MKYRPIPNTDITVSEVGFGTWTMSTGWWGEVDDERATRMFRKAYDDYGVTLFDAADSYGNGRSEEQLAKTFGSMRDKVVYATKFGYDIYANSAPRTGQRELEQNVSPGFIRYACEQSLKRLNTDYIDIYQLHNAKMEHIEDDALFETLEALKTEGKIRCYAVALGPAIGWLAEGVLSIRERKVPVLQIIQNLLEQHPGNTMIEESRRHNNQTVFLARVPHSSGMLEGHYTAETKFDPKDHRSHRPRHWLLNGVQKVEQLRFLELPNRTLGQAALKFLLAEPLIASTLPNIYTEEQLHEFATASDCPDLTREELDRIQELVSHNFGIEEPAMHYKGTMDYPEPEASLVS